MGRKHNASIVQGEWWRLITPTFLHGGIIHLAVNSLALHNLGPTLENLSGRPRFLAVYGVAGFSGVVASCLGSARPSLGASGAIFGVAGAIAVFFQRHKQIFGPHSDEILQNLGRTLAINVAYGFMSRGVDNWGHMGGLLGGAAAGYLLGPALKKTQLPDSHQYTFVDRPPLPIFVPKIPATAHEQN